MLCLLVYFLDHLWMTSFFFDVNRFLFIYGLKNRKVSHVVHMPVGLIVCLTLLKNRTHSFSMFTNPSMTLAFT